MKIVMDLSGRSYGCFIVVMIMMFGLIGMCINGENDGDSVGAPMVKTEQEALYSAVQGFVGEWWNGSDLYPDPCGWTPIQASKVPDFEEGPMYDDDGVLPDDEEECRFVRRALGGTADQKENLRSETDLCTLFGSEFYGSRYSNELFHIVPDENKKGTPQDLQGVSCDMFDGFWYVTDLSIGQIHENSLPCASNLEFRPQFFQLKHLKSLTVFNCMIKPTRTPISIQSVNWDSFSSTLESLEFRANPGLTGPIPTSFGNLKKLQSLVLIDNALTGSLPVSIGGLSLLKRLVISGNMLTGKIPESYGYLSELLIMDLSRNSLCGSLPLTFGGLTSLLKFDLSKNQINGEIPSEISKLKNLTLLDLSNNKISSGLTFANQEMSSLEELILSNNPISGDLVNFNWQNVHRLMVLDLSNMGLTGTIPESISSLKNLRFLGLNNNKLSGHLSPKLAELGNLTALYVNGNNLTGDLKFTREFYVKMGRRFGVRNNPNLCFPIAKLSPHVRPFGVKVCQEKTS